MQQTMVDTEIVMPNREEGEFRRANYWDAVAARDRSMDGVFYYAVLSTGIYCRPSCPSKRPRRENVVFFRARDAAEHAGFRPCKRCKPEAASASRSEWSWSRKFAVTSTRILASRSHSKLSAKRSG